MGRLIAAYRRHPAHGTALTQELVAQWSGQSQARISRYENGSPDQQIDRLIFWAQLLAIPEHLLWFQLPNRVRTGIDEPAAATSSHIHHEPGLKAGDVFRSAIHSFRKADKQVGGGFLYDTVAKYLRTEVAPRLFDARQGRDSEFAFRAAASLTEMSGWMAHDAGQDADATHHFERAFDFVRVGNDSQLTAHILCSLAHLANHQGRVADAIRFSERAWRMLAEGPRQPELEARVLSVHAVSNAIRRDRIRCIEMLRAAERAIETRPEAGKSEWVSPFDAGSLAASAARCFRTIGDLTQAQHYAERVVELRPDHRTRSRALGQLILTAVLISRGYPGEACRVADEALTATEQIGSLIVIRQLQALRSQFAPFRADPEVAEFLQRLDGELRQRAWLYHRSERGPEPATDGHPG